MGIEHDTIAAYIASPALELLGYQATMKRSHLESCGIDAKRHKGATTPISRTESCSFYNKKTRTFAVVCNWGCRLVSDGGTVSKIGEISVLACKVFHNGTQAML